MERLTFYNNDNKKRKEMKTSAVIRPLPVNVMREVKDYVMIAIGMILYGIGWTLFLLPQDITASGVPGIASIVYFAGNWAGSSV